jgi:iron transport multicopper oxidase
MYFAQNMTNLPPMLGTTPGGPTSAVGFNENATLPFVPGKTYRLRIINTSAISSFFFFIDGHNMTLIEADGVRSNDYPLGFEDMLMLISLYKTDIQASPIDGITITAAQRYSVLVTARNDTLHNWAIHANMVTSMFEVVPPSLSPSSLSLLFSC